MRACELCGEEYLHTGYRQRYCSEMCKRIARRRRDGLKAVIKTCPMCGEEFLASGKGIRYCGKHTTREKKRFQQGDVVSVGDPMNCGCCGEVITRRAPNQKFCKAPCRPAQGKTMACVRCGVDKPIHEYSDYRMVGRKLHTACKDCLRIDARDRARKKRLT